MLSFNLPRKISFCAPTNIVRTTPRAFSFSNLANVDSQPTRLVRFRLLSDGHNLGLLGCNRTARVDLNKLTIGSLLQVLESRRPNRNTISLRRLTRILVLDLCNYTGCVS